MAFSNNELLNAPVNARVTNRTCTARYTVWNFVPKNLSEQFRRLANVYFLLIGLVQATTRLSPTGRWNTLGPLLVVFCANAAREVFEDLQRHAQDRADNERLALVLADGGARVPTPWAAVRVGDTVEVREGEEVPVDAILLTADGADGEPDVSACYVETSNLDGEVALTPRAVARVHAPGGGEAVAVLRQLRAAELVLTRVRVDYEHASANLHAFCGTIALCDEAGAAREPLGRAPVSMSNLLLRGTVLRNSARAIALVVYTGPDVRSVRNSLATPSKRSDVERRTDKVHRRARARREAAGQSKRARDKLQA